MSDRSVNSATLKPSSNSRRRLAPSEKYEIFVSVLTGQATQREAAAKWKVDRSTVTHICQVAKRGAGRAGRRRETGALVRQRAGTYFGLDVAKTYLDVADRPWPPGVGSTALP